VPGAGCRTTRAGRFVRCVTCGGRRVAAGSARTVSGTGWRTDGGTTGAEYGAENGACSGARASDQSRPAPSRQAHANTSGTIRRDPTPPFSRARRTALSYRGAPQRLFVPRAARNRGYFDARSDGAPADPDPEDTRFWLAPHPSDRFTSAAYRPNSRWPLSPRQMVLAAMQFSPPLRRRTGAIILAGAVAALLTVAADAQPSPDTRDQTPSTPRPLTLRPLPRRPSPTPKQAPATGCSCSSSRRPPTPRVAPPSLA
jgi:hypothetical protein